MDDIGHVLEDSLNDLSWWNEGLDGMGKTVDISEVKNPNNVKPELSYQWRGGPDFDFEDTAAGDVKKTPPKEEANPRKVIHFARDMMNRGYRFPVVVRELGKRFAKVDLIAAKDGLMDLAKGNGLIGRIVLDARGYGSCKEALASIQHSPWKSFIKYIVGCHCGDHVAFNEDSHPELSIVGGKIASVDDHFDNGATKAKTVVRCASTHLRIADENSEGIPFGGADGAQEGYSSDILRSDILRMGKLGYLSKEKVDEILASDLPDIAKVREAFKNIDFTLEKDENTKYEVDVDPSEYQMDVADGIELNPERNTPNDDVALGEVKEDIETTSTPEVSVEMKPETVNDYDGSNEIETNSVSYNDVEMDAVPDGDYEGLDAIELDSPKEQKPEEKVDVDTNVDFEF